MSESRTSGGAAAPVVVARGVDKTFASGARAVRALRAVDLELPAGRLIAIHGRSGSGKTTLLNVLGGLERIDAGSVEVCGVDLVAATDDQLAAFRRERVAFVFQNFGLVDVLTAAENVGLVLRSTVERRARDDRVARELERTGLASRADHLPDELSGGEQQRVAVARALAAEADLLIADEPTAQLDVATGGIVIDALRHAVERRSATVLVATHDPALVDAADVSIGMSDGELTG